MVRKQNKATGTAQAVPLLTTPGTFFVLTATRAEVHVLTSDQVTAYFAGLAIVEQTNARGTEMYRAQLLRQTFGTRDAVMALPAPSLAAMLWYAEHWTGALKDTVRGLAACHATGTPFGPDDDGNTGDGGVKARLAPLAPVPNAPTGATFQQPAQVQA